MPEIGSGAALWEHYSAPLMSLEEVPPRLPSLDFNRVRPLLAEEVARLRAAAPQLTAHLSPEASARWMSWLDDVQPLATLASWLRAQLDTSTEGTSEFHTLLEEAAPLRQAGLWNLQLGESLSLIAPNTAREIRSGQGHLDTAQDLLALSGVLTPHWSTLEPLQAHAPSGLGLTLALLQRFAPLGDALIEAQHRRTGNEPIGWRDRLLRCLHLLALRWDSVRFAAQGGWALAGDLEAAKVPAPSLYAMHQRR